VPWRVEGTGGALVGLLVLTWRLLVVAPVVLSCCYVAAGSPFVALLVACAGVDGPPRCSNACVVLSEGPVLVCVGGGGMSGEEESWEAC